ncbi:MAG: PLP-dependent cysteine synthase family protein [Gemmatimonadota bacterium]|nr:PLP-dependent cysteine synthase family protein [Gemmatimonadota bacterium]
MSLASSTPATRFQGLRRLVGNTPLLAVDYTLDGRPRRVFAKSENLNMTGSIKDRMALHILRRAYERGTIRPGSLIVEATSGNTGVSFAAIGRALGHPVAIFMPDWMSAERVNLIRGFGARIHAVSKEDGGFLESIRRAEALAEETPGAFLPRQFANEDNCEAHEVMTGPEIWWQLEAHRLRPDAIVAGVGTGGTIMGAGTYLRSKRAEVRVHPLEPANSPTLSTGHRVGRHRIQGISDEFVPPIVELDRLDEIVAVDDGDAILMAQKLASDLGLGVGISSGANFLGAVRVHESMGGDATVVTVFCDSNKKYLSTDLLKDEPAEPDHLSPRIELLGFTSFNRVCRTCFETWDLPPTALGPPV